MKRYVSESIYGIVEKWPYVIKTSVVECMSGLKATNCEKKGR